MNRTKLLDKALLIIMAKWHGFGRCKTRLSKDIGKSNSAKVQSAMTKHTISVAKFLQENKLIDISIAISGLGLSNCRRWSRELGIKKFNLQGKGCLGEKMMSSHIYLPFINIKWGTENVLQNTINNFASTELKYKFLDKKIDIDTIIDIDNRK